MKKIVYTLGALAAVVTPVVAVVSCGSKGNGGSSISLEVGNYPSDSWFKEVSNNQIKEGEQFLDGGQDVGSRYLVTTKNAALTSAKDLSTGEPAALVTRAVKELLKNRTAQLQNNFQFFYIQIIDTEKNSMKSTKTIYLPRFQKETTDADDAAWVTRVTPIYEGLIKAQTLSSSTKDIPVSAYNAPSTYNVNVTVEPTQVGMARVFTSGQRYPQLDANGHLPEAIMDKYLSATLKAPSVSDPRDGVLGGYETEYNMSFTNELYFSEVVSALHIYRDSLPTWFLRQYAYVANDDTNGFKVPYAHLPQNPMDYNRMLSGLKTTLSKVKFVRANANSYLEWNEPFNNYSMYFNDGLQIDANGKLTPESAAKVADAYLSNSYVKTQSKYAPFSTSLSVITNSEIKTKTDKFINDLSSTSAYDFLKDGDYKMMVKTDVSLADGTNVETGKYVKASEAMKVWEWWNYFDATDVVKLDPANPDNDSLTLSNEEKTVYLSLYHMASEWWSDGSFADSTKNLEFSEILTSLQKHIEQKDARDFAVQQLLEWSMKDQIQTSFTKWSFDTAKNNATFTIDSTTDNNSLVAKLLSLDFKTIEEMATP